jgi:hypothetical protein
VHCGPWFCVSSMRCSPQFGVLSSPASQPVAFDFKGSDAMTLISARSHLGHSNNRCSKPIGSVETRSSIIRVWQREQQGRSIAVRNCWDEGTILPCVGREHTNSPSPMAADGWTMMASAFAHRQRCGRDHRRVIDIGSARPSTQIPGQAGIVEAMAARMPAAVRWHSNVATAPPEKPARWPSAGALGKRLQTARLA